MIIEYNRLYIQSTDPLGSNQSRPLIASITGDSSESDRGAVGEGVPRTQPLATIPTSESRETDEDQMFDLSCDFAEMYCKLVPLLSRAVTADKLKCYLWACRHPTSNRPYVEPSLYDHCTSTKEILDILLDHHYYHPTHVRLLKRIAALGCDNCKRVLQEYEAKIPMSAALKRRRDFPSGADTDSSRSTKKIKVTVEGNPETYSLLDVEKIESALEEATGVSPDVIVLIRSEPGSVVLTFLVPTSMAEHFVNISKDDSSLARSGVLNIEIDNTVIEIQAQMPSAHKREVESTSQLLEELSILEKEDDPPVKSQLQPWPGVDPTLLHTSGEQHPLYGLSDPPYTHGTAEELSLQQLALGKEKLPPHGKVVCVRNIYKQRACNYPPNSCEQEANMELILVSLSTGKAIHRMDHLIYRTLTRQQRRRPYIIWLSTRRNSPHIVSWSIAGLIGNL